MFYDGFFQYLLQEGFSIFAPNFRGTPNYGTSFLKMIEGDWGGAPRLDILAGVEMLAENRGVDSGKFILFGGSYGGYMSLLLSGRHPEKFKACVDICGDQLIYAYRNMSSPLEKSNGFLDRQSGSRP
ncbi:alpha/beta hydrolase family protein [Neobacillus sp. PS3-34]|uniref:alpha/beta hydrolase family protein n=1 Tax=Neobacillus sp. PS3-34 TaxID=3070678 RepID=UPI0035A670B5